jgi:hypothetical protein
MKINTLPCPACVHTEVCSYKEKYVNYIMEVYPAVPPCDLFKHFLEVKTTDGKRITFYSK